MAGRLLRSRWLRYASADLSGQAIVALVFRGEGHTLRYADGDVYLETLNAKIAAHRLWHLKDVNYGGAYAISGTIKEDGVPSRNRLILMDRRTWVIVRSYTSGDDGHYHFQNLDNTTDFVILAVDDEGEWMPKAFDFVRAT